MTTKLTPPLSRPKLEPVMRVVMIECAKAYPNAQPVFAHNLSLHAANQLQRLGFALVSNDGRQTFARLTEAGMNAFRNL